MDSLSMRSSMRSQSWWAGEGGGKRIGRPGRAGAASQEPRLARTSASTLAARPVHHGRRATPAPRPTISRMGRRLLSMVGWMYCSVTNSMRPREADSWNSFLAIHRARKRLLQGEPQTRENQGACWRGAQDGQISFLGCIPKRARKRLLHHGARGGVQCLTAAQGHLPQGPLGKHNKATPPQSKTTTITARPTPLPQTPAPARIHGLVAQCGRRQEVGQVAQADVLWVAQQLFHALGRGLAAAALTGAHLAAAARHPTGTRQGRSRNAEGSVNDKQARQAVLARTVRAPGAAAEPLHHHAATHKGVCTCSPS